MAGFVYGWGEKPDDEPAVMDPNNPTGAGGAIGSQPLSQTGGSGAGVSPTGFTDPSLFDQSSLQTTTPTGAGAAGAGASAPLPTTPTPAGSGTAAPTPAPLPDFTDLLNKIQTATDPQQAALSKDQLSRQLYSSLSEQGHDVKWEGDQLIVDGRPYVVGGTATTAQTQAAGTGPAGGGAGLNQAPQAGQWAPTNQGFLDWATKNFGADANSFVKIDPAQFQQILARYTQETGNQANYIGGPSGDQVDFGQGTQDALTSSGQIWNNESTGAGGPGGSRPGATTGGGGYGTWTGSPDTAPGVMPGMPTAPAPVAQPTTTSEWGDQLKRLLAGQGGGNLTMADLQGGLGNPITDDGWRPGGGGYVPGEIGMSDVEGLPSYEKLLADMSQGQEGTQALLARIMANPESMNQATTDTMKAQMKDTLAEQQAQEEEDLRGFGAASGIADSPWLASERSNSRRARDMAVAKGAQNVDITAATTNAADRRAAAGLGIQAGDSRRAAVQAASSAAIAKVAATGDRLQLRESVKQEAAKLKISEDQVMSNFLQGKADNLMKKYGIDLGASLDVAKLNQQSQEFREDLMQKMAALEQSLSMQKYGIDTGAATSKYATDVGAATSRYGTDVGAGTSRYGIDVNAGQANLSREQQDRQYAASLGLDYDKFNFMRDQDQWKRMQDLYGGA
jgi:hypothetical protein